MTIEQIKQSIRNVPDFPIPGVQFKDITTIISNPEQLQYICQETAGLYAGKGITKVIGIESRGFIFAPAVAMQLNAGFVPIRKPGKLPYECYEETYKKEYGLDRIQIHKDALSANDVVLIHDDLLATGGSMRAAVDLVKKIGVKKIYVNFIIELDALEGRKLLDDVEVTSLIHF